MILCKPIPVRFWILVLIFLNWFLMTCTLEHVHICWKMIIEQKSTDKFKPWCQLSSESNKTILSNRPIKIPGYNYIEEDFGPRYNWTSNKISNIISAQLYGHMVSALPGGILAEYIGPYYVVIYATVIAATLNSLRVLFADIEWNVLMVSEFVLGLHAGIAFPALLVWIARWAPPNERGIFVASQMGSSLAIGFSTVFTRLMAPVMGWRGTFYILSIITFLYVIALWMLGCNHPEDHKLITAKELLYIKRAQRGKATSTRSIPPFGRILSSKAFWALNVLHFGHMCAMKYFLYIVPNYLTRFIGIPSRTEEFIQIFPKFGFASAALFACLLGDYLRVKKVLNSAVVKINTVFSHFVPGSLLFFIGIAHCNQNVCVALHAVGYTACGCATLNCFRTVIDLAPNYAGTIYGLIYLSSCIEVIANPFLTTFIFKINDGIVGWTILFHIGGGCLIGTGVMFLFLGNNYEQWWNLKSQDRFKIDHYKKPKRLQIVAKSSQHADTAEAKSIPHNKNQTVKHIRTFYVKKQIKTKGPKNNQVLYHASNLPTERNFGKALLVPHFSKNNRRISHRTEARTSTGSTKRRNVTAEFIINKKPKLDY